MALRLLTVAVLLASVGAVRDSAQAGTRIAAAGHDDLMAWLSSRCPDLQDASKNSGTSLVKSNLGRLFGSLEHLSMSGFLEQTVLKEFSKRGQEHELLNPNNLKWKDMLQKAGYGAKSLAGNALENAGSVWRNWRKPREPEDLFVHSSASVQHEPDRTASDGSSGEHGALLQVKAGGLEWEQLYQYYWTNAVWALIPLRIYIAQGLSPERGLGKSLLDTIDVLHDHMQRSTEEGQPAFFPEWVSRTFMNLTLSCIEQRADDHMAAELCQQEMNLQDKSSMWSRVNSMASAVQLLAEDLAKKGVSGKNCVR